MFSQYVLRWLHALVIFSNLICITEFISRARIANSSLRNGVNNQWFIDTSHDIALFDDAEFIRFLGYNFNMDYDGVDESIINWRLFNRLDISPSWGLASRYTTIGPV